MFKLKILAIIAIGGLTWWLPGWALEQADRLTQEGTGGVPGRVIPPPVPRPMVAPTIDPRTKDEKKNEPAQGAVNAAIDDFSLAGQANPAVDDFPFPRAVLEANPDGFWLEPILVPVDPADKEKLRQAGIYRNIANTTKEMWWYLPVGLAVLLVLSKTTNIFKRREHDAPQVPVATDTAAGDKLDIEALLIELERLRRATPEGGKEAAGEKPIVNS